MKLDLQLKPLNVFFVSAIFICISTYYLIKKFYFLEPRVYEGYIDYLPHDANDNTAQTNPITSNSTIAQLHQHLLPINEPISTDSTTSKWRRIDGPFSYVLITSKPALSKDVLSTPQSTLADGFLTIQYVRTSDTTRANLAKAFTSLADGKHLEYDFVHCLNVRAFRIVPVGTEGNLMVDGEKVPYGKVNGIEKKEMFY